MKRIGVREFRDHAARYLAGDEVLAVERHGQPIGFYVPTKATHREAVAVALDRLEQRVQQVIAETGLSEDDLSELFDLIEQLAHSPREESKSVAADTHAPRR